jgi:hypothetical protein
MLVQLQSVTVKMHASPRSQKPLHAGAEASPHGVVRHSQAPPATTAEQRPPFEHEPPHVRLSLSN